MSARQLPKYRMRLLGVFDEQSGAPIIGAEVTDLASGWSALTTATGTVSLYFLPDGGSLVRVRKVGYAPITLPIAISPTVTAPVTLTMVKATELPAVVTRDNAPVYQPPGLSGFLEREHEHATGYFIDDSILRKEENRPLAIVLTSRIPGMVIKEAPGSQAYFGGGPRCGSGGPRVYVDNVLMTKFNLNGIGVSELAGVEYYPSGSTAPAAMSRASQGCALYLWTRTR